MKINRRVFFHIFGGTTCAVLLPLSAKAMSSSTTHSQEQVEKAIKASFGGGFQVYEHINDKRLNYATIGHAGKRYLVASKGLHDWQVISSKI